MIINDYLRHRERREAQVVEALRAGAATPEAVALKVYGQLPPTIGPAAVESVLAHLVKLEEEGRATKEGVALDSKWRLA